MRAPHAALHAAVAARKWPFTPVLRADWNALRSTGSSAPHAADRSPALPRTQLGSDYAPHTKWQQWGSTCDARGPPRGKCVHLAHAQGCQQQPRRQITPATVSGSLEPRRKRRACCSTCVKIFTREARASAQASDGQKKTTMRRPQRGRGRTALYRVCRHVPAQKAMKLCTCSQIHA